MTQIYDYTKSQGLRELAGYRESLLMEYIRTLEDEIFFLRIKDRLCQHGPIIHWRDSSIWPDLLELDCSLSEDGHE